MKWAPFSAPGAKLEIGFSVRPTERVMTKKMRRKIDTALKAKIALVAL